MCFVCRIMEKLELTNQTNFLSCKIICNKKTNPMVFMREYTFYLQKITVKCNRMEKCFKRYTENLDYIFFYIF